MKIRKQRKLPAPPIEPPYEPSHKERILQKIHPELKPGEKFIVSSSKGHYFFKTFANAKRKQEGLMALGEAAHISLQFSDGSALAIPRGTDFLKSYQQKQMQLRAAQHQATA